MGAFDGWVTKGEAAQRLGKSIRSIERLIEEGKIRKGKMAVPGEKPIPVLHPDDIAKLENELIPPAPANSSTEVIVTPRSQLPQLPRLVAETVAGVLAAIPPPPRGLFLSLKEAAVYTGLPQSFLRRQIQEGTLPYVKVGGYRVSRRALNVLCRQLSQPIPTKGRGRFGAQRRVVS